MKRTSTYALMGLLLLSLSSGFAFGRGGGGRGGGGGARGGGGFSGGAARGGGGFSGGVSRPSAGARSPSLSRPQAPSGGQRPSTGRQPSIGQRPSVGGGQRPSVGQHPGTGGRPSQLPSTGQRPNTGQRPSGGQRPGTGQRPGIGARPGQLPGGGQRPGTGGRPGQFPGAGERPSRGDLSDFLGLPKDRPGANRPSTLPSVNVGDRTTINVGNSANVGNRAAVGSRATGRPGYAHHPHWPGYRPGRPAWTGGRHAHYHSHYYGRRYPSNYWWRAATATAVTGWFVNAWARPIYYTYGTGGNVYYENNVVYVDGQQYATSQEYYDQSTTIATSLPEVTEEQAAEIEWLPLGVFALSDDSGESNRVLQLAVSKDGVITGSYYNEATDASRPIEGTVDKQTQRAAWTFADGEDTHIVMETMIYNLTEDKTTALVHFGPDQTQEWTMTRLEEPADSGQ